jgi:transposase
MSRRSIKPTGLPVINDRAAGIDIGARFHVVGVAPELCDDPVQTFQAFTSDIERMADWLVSIGIDTVAMESTGVYWVPVYEVLQRHGLEVIVANAREARAVPGRKSDVNDAQWLQRLHACGLLRPSFRPERDIAALRAYLRLRERHLDYAAAHIQHMQKALTHELAVAPCGQRRDWGNRDEDHPRHRGRPTRSERSRDNARRSL